MGNYVFDTQTLIDIVSPTGDDDMTTDIGGDVIPALTQAGVAHMYDFSTNVIPGQAEHERGYWRDVGRLDAYYEANMDLLAPVPPFSLYNRAMAGVQPAAAAAAGEDRSRPGSAAAMVLNSLLCAGSIVSGGKVERSILGPETYVDASAKVTESILFPGVRVGPGARLHRSVIDKNVEVPAGAPSATTSRRREKFVVSEQRRGRRREGPPPGLSRSSQRAHAWRAAAVHPRQRGYADDSAPPARTSSTTPIHRLDRGRRRRSPPRPRR